MKRLSYYAIIGLLIAPLYASAEVGVSISVGQPGFYGQIQLGDAPRPQLIYPQPQWIYSGPAGIEPIYLYVPPRHARNWPRYCGQYHACKRPVYFVRDSWYNTVYVPYYRENYVYRDGRHEWKHRGDNRNYGKHHDDNGKHRGHDKGNHGDSHGKNH